MRLLVGYQSPGRERLRSAILRNRDRIGEVYFAWPDIPSGRGTMAMGDGAEPCAVRERLLADLAEVRGAGIGLNLLLNGHCYGALSLARSFYDRIGEVVDHLVGEFQLRSVTTSSPVIARFLGQNFPGLERRASVNMEIGTCEGMDYLADCFDGFYLQREQNRCWDRIQELRRWCDGHGKRLYALANSGCLNHCSAHAFHDNLVAHEHEIRRMDNAYGFTGICRQWLGRAENRAAFLAHANFIRPEDLHLYEGCFDGVKLATRSNPNPAAVVEAYCRGGFSGNLLSLLEPDHAREFYPEIIENARLPEDFGERLLHGGGPRRQERYCREALRGAIVNLEDWNLRHEQGQRGTD